MIPTPKQIKAARLAANLTQAAAAALILKKWRQWANYEAGKSEMDAALWQLFRLKLILTETVA